VYSEKEAEDMIKKEEDRYDGYFIYRSGGMWTGAAQKIIETGQPVVMADDLYAGSGGFLKNYSYARKNNLPVVGIASSDFHDVIDAVKLFEVLQKMKVSKVLVIQDRETGMGSNARAGSIKELFGTDILQMNSDELKSYYEKTDQKEAEIWKNKWIDEAVEVRGPSEEEILKSARMYLAVKQIMKEKKADAVTIDCLGLFYADRLTAYPCLAFFQLNNEGSTGVCEADLDSTITQLMMRYAAGIPGFVSDPVIDTSCSQIIYAHCVGTNRVYGPDDTANPYSIRTHAEDQKGAAIQSLMPIGEQVTTLKINVMEKAIAVHQGRTVANVNDEKGCRTK
jgi:L-fucose isomerase-like protein